MNPDGNVFTDLAEIGVVLIMMVTLLLTCRKKGH